MTRFRAALARIYRALPVIRELRQTNGLLLLIYSDFHRSVFRERYEDPKRLLKYEHQVFSQHGEDGIIAEILQRIGAEHRSFVEIGVGDGLENNTAFLLSQGWHGWWFDASRRDVSSINRTFRKEIASERLRVTCAQVTRENVCGLLQAEHIPKEFDVLSIDVDRNTYWVWAGLADFKPRLVVVEYNASLPPSVDFKVEYRPEAFWDGTSYFGASLKALELLGNELGYSLVGCETAGVNAFFVRTDLCRGQFSAPYSAENHYEPPRYLLSGRFGHLAGWGD
jgi:hypothetical protein